MKIREVEVLIEARDDLIQGRTFYDFQSPSVGDYFVESVLADLGALRLYAGIHRRVSGFIASSAAGYPLPFITIFRRTACKLPPYWICAKIRHGYGRALPHESPAN